MSNSANTIRLHRVLRAPAERVYRAFLDPDGDGQVASSARLHRQGPRNGRTRRGRLPDVVHELRHRYEPFFRRNVHRADPTRANPIHRQVRRPEHAGRDAGLDHAARGRLRNRARNHTARAAFGDSSRILLPGVAGVAVAPGAPRRTRDSGRAVALHGPLRESLEETYRSRAALLARWSRD